MGWRFRQSFKVIPGLRLNLSKSGLSASIGGAPFTFNVGPHGLTGTASIPGTGISYREHLDSHQTPEPSLPPGVPNSRSQDPTSTPSFFPSPTPAPSVSSAPIEEIHSASTELLTSESLKELKKLMQTTFEERDDISRQLETARPAQQRAMSRYGSWERGFLFKRLFKKAFARRKVESETTSARVAELEEQLQLTRIATHVEIEREQAEPYFRMRDDFASMCECAAIWDIKSHQATDQFHERTTATMRVARQRVSFRLDDCDLIQWEQKVPHIQNAKGGDLFLYPGFILYRAGRGAFSVIDYHDVQSKSYTASFQEEEGVPADAKVIGQTWAKANKDGSRDRRFADNHQIPIAAYGCVTLKSASGLWEEFQFSNPERLLRFLGGLKAFSGSFAALPSTN